MNGAPTVAELIAILQTANPDSPWIAERSPAGYAVVSFATNEGKIVHVTNAKETS